MELQDFINDTDNYIKAFKDSKMNVKKYSQLDLLLVKTYSNQTYDYEKNPWMKYCRGVIINMKTDRVICIPPLKSKQEKEINIDDYDESYSFEPLVDGTMINVFFHNDKWFISTRSNIGAKNSWDGKVPFYKLFTEVNHGDQWLEGLKKDHCYSFTLQHKKNRIVSPILENKLYLIEMYDLSNGGILKVDTEKLDVIDGIMNNFLILRSDIGCYLNMDNSYSVKGFTIKRGTERIKWINPNYEYVNNLKRNFNNKFLSYIELRQQWKLSEYLKYFPEERHIYNLYRDRYSQIKNELYESYIAVHITKSKEFSEVNYVLKPLIYEIHGYYLKHKHKINMSYINEYMQNIPGKRLLFIYNYLFNKP